MYQNACGAAAASAGGCVETDKECHGLITKEAKVPVVEHDYSGFDIVKATQVRLLIVLFWFFHLFQSPFVFIVTV